MKRVQRVLSILLFLLLTGSTILFAVPSSAVTTYGTADQIQFGTYPQSKVSETPELKAAAEAATWRSYKYFSNIGSDSNPNIVTGDFMRFADFFCDGDKYRAVVFDSYRPAYTSWSLNTIDPVSPQEVNKYYANKIYYFKYEALLWRILNPSDGYIMCESLIDSQPFIIVKNSGTNVGSQNQTEEKYDNDYADSSIRAWLNYEFYETAFSDSQKTIIKTTTLNNDACYQIYSVYNSMETHDKIFLLSHADAISLSSEKNREAKGTDYAKCQGLYVYKESPYKGNSEWWLRSAGAEDDYVCLVNYNGVVLNSGIGLLDTIQTGVRPACCVSNLVNDISLSTALFSKAQGSSGEIDDPTNPSTSTNPTNPSTPTEQTQPLTSSNDGNSPTPKLNFFQRIIQWFRNLFAKLFGR